jgi:hypothetical protein
MTVKNNPGGSLNEEVCVARITKEIVTQYIWIQGSRQYRCNWRRSPCYFNQISISILDADWSNSPGLSGWSVARAHKQNTYQWRNELKLEVIRKSFFRYKTARILRLLASQCEAVILYTTEPDSTRGSLIIISGSVLNILLLVSDSRRHL